MWQSITTFFPLFTERNWPKLVFRCGSATDGLDYGNNWTASSWTHSIPCLYHQRSLHSTPFRTQQPTSTLRVSRLLYYSVEQNPSWEANSHSASQEITLPFMEPQRSLPCSLETAISPHPEPDESSPHHLTLSLRSILILSTHLRLGVHVHLRTLLLLLIYAVSKHLLRIVKFPVQIVLRHPITLFSTNKQP
jgi:hypothetical protein